MGAGHSTDPGQHGIECLLDIHGFEQQAIDLLQSRLRADSLLERFERQVEALRECARRVDRALGIDALEATFLQSNQCGM
jgi:hypothetical protein